MAVEMALSMIRHKGYEAYPICLFIKDENERRYVAEMAGAYYSHTSLISVWGVDGVMKRMSRPKQYETPLIYSDCFNVLVFNLRVAEVNNLFKK